MRKEAPAAEAPGPADAPKGNWVDRFAPGPVRPFLRLMRADRPIGTWLLLIPCWQGLALALADDPSRWREAIYCAALFAVGAVAMRGAGCAYNDIVDRDIDAKVARTALRPLPSGQITLAGAWALLFALALVGLVVLVQFNTYTVYLGLASLGLVAVYPFMKRVTWWPQAWLGLAFNWGALVGYSALAGNLAPEALALYAAGVFWTLGYDTIYAHQDKEDDALIGVKSSARRLADRTKPALLAFYGAMLALLAAAGALADLGAFYFVALAGAALHVFVQVSRVDTADAASCLAVFRSNRDAGLLVLAALLSGALL
jgi:4-hydroxybenzoate polyprenyltransferase